MVPGYWKREYLDIRLEFGKIQRSSATQETKVHFLAFGAGICRLGQQVSVGLVISLLILVDLSLTLLMLLQFYSVGIEAVLLIVLFLPFSSVLPSAAGLNALFSRGSKRSAGLALWNATSLVNVLVALVVGFLHYNMGLGLHSSSVQPKNIIRSEENTWGVTCSSRTSQEFTSTDNQSSRRQLGGSRPLTLCK